MWEDTPVIERSERRVRVRLGDRTIADSHRCWLLIEYGPQRLPTYFFPRAQIDPAAIGDEIRRENGRIYFAMPGMTGAWAWTFESPQADLAPLAQCLSFGWQAPLQWFEEDEPVFVHARDPHKRVDALRSSRHVVISYGGELLAESTSPVLMFETGLPVRYYLPPDDVCAHLQPSDLRSACPYKGDAVYFHVAAGDEYVENLVWAYPQPIAECASIKGRVCFYNEKVEILVDGEPQPRPRTPWS